MGRAGVLAVAFVIVAAVVATFARLPYGADVQDEPMHLVDASRFADGSVPYVDELLSSPQNAALLLAPVVGVYEAVAGRDGLVLFSRRLYLLYTLVIAGALTAGLRRFVPAGVAAALGTTAVAFAPFNYQDFHQNTIAGPCFAVGAVLGLAALEGRHRVLAVLAGLAHGVAIFVYPFFLLPVVAAVAALVLLFGRARSLVLWVAAGLAVPLAALGVVVLWAGVENVSDALSYASDWVGQGGTAGKLKETVRYRFDAFPNKLVAVVAVAALLGLAIRRPHRARAGLLLLPLIPLAPALLDDNAGSVDYVANLALLGAMAVLLTWREDLAARRLALAVWAPAIVAGLTVSWASSNDGINFGVGAYAAALGTMALIARATGPVPGVAAALALVALLVGFQWGSVYRDEAVPRLDAEIRSGAFSGVRTTLAKRVYLEHLAADIAAADGTRLFVYDELPVGYLVSDLQPYTATGWALHHPEPAYRRLLLAYFTDHRGLPDVVVRARTVPLKGSDALALEYSSDDPLDRLVRLTYRPVVRRPEYDVLLRR